MIKPKATIGIWLVLAAGCGTVRHGPSLAASGVPGPRLAVTGRPFLGRPYQGGILDDGHPGERLCCRLDAFDCVTFVETCLALARAERAGRAKAEAAFPAELERIRYRDGRREGYATRLHYFSDWIQDNAARGHLVDLTASLGGVPDERPLHFMTTRKELYPALADPATFGAIRAAELRLSGTPRSRLPKAKVPAVIGRIQDGDILGFTSSTPGLDIAHVGLACRGEDGVLRVMHASSKAGCVTISRESLVDYLMGVPRFSGLVVVRAI